MRFGSQCVSNGNDEALTYDSNSRREAFELNRGVPVLESCRSSLAPPVLKGDYMKYIDDDLSSI